jgi:hypothetical protein
MQYMRCAVSFLEKPWASNLGFFIGEKTSEGGSICLAESQNRAKYMNTVVFYQ